MNWNRTIELGTKTESVSHGETIYTYTYVEVYANKLNLFHREKNSYLQIGLKVSAKVEVREYSGQDRARMDGVEYIIEDASENQKNETYELVLSRAYDG